MNNNNHNIRLSNAPPVERQKTKDKRQKYSSSDTFYFTLFTFSLTLGQPLLNMRDGPRGREPAIGFTRLAVADGVPVTLINNPSVALCGFSVDSVVKKLKLQRTQRIHRERRELLNKSRPCALQGN